jgi:4,5-dihydroxyphthalate decarboxylase
MLKLKTALATRPHTRALKDGSVKPRSFEFEFEEVPAIVDAFRRMVRGLEFDVSEMAMTTYLCARAYGKPITAIPIFPMRAFHHGAILYSARSGVRTPKDLEGRQVGVNRGYTVTTGVWARAILQHEYGVDLRRVTWVRSGDEHVAEFRHPSNVVPIEAGKTLEGMLTAGEIAAAVGLQVESPDVRPLIPHAREAGFEVLRRHGIYPINHTVVVRNELLEAHPHLAHDLFDAFALAKQAGAKPTPQRDEVFLQLTAMIGDAFPYGIEPNRPTLDAIVRYAVEQEILPQTVATDALFARTTRALVA